MKFNFTKTLAFASAVAMLSTAVAGFGVMAAGTTVPQGYVETPEQNVYLNPGEYYVQYWGEEADFGETGHFEVPGAQTLATDIANSGEQSACVHLTDGSAGGFKVLDIMDMPLKTNVANAKYLQFWVKNTTPLKNQEGNPCNDLELFFVKSGSPSTLISVDNVAAKLFDQTTGKWSNAEQGTNVHNTNAIKIPPQFEGFVRLPLPEVLTFDALNWVQSYMMIPGVPAGGAKVYFDDFGFVTYNGETAPEFVDEAEPVVPDPYLEKPVQKVQLNKGESYKQIAGFEDADTSKWDPDKRLSIESDVKNSGDKALCATTNDGSASGHLDWQVNIDEKNQDITDAKYLQFWVNVAPTSGNPLELFYVQINGKRLFAKGDKGIKLYNQKTGEWEDREITDEKMGHVLGGTETPVPALDLPVGFRGLVRIPLTDDFKASVDNTAKKIQSYVLSPGTPGPTKHYFDDIGFVTYEGETAPAYTNGTPDPDPEIPVDPNPEVPSIPDFGEDTTPDNKPNTDVPTVPTGVTDNLILCGILMIMSIGTVCVMKKKAVKR